MPSELQSVHFIGVCGTAMAAVASALRARRVTVTGSDQNAYPPMSTYLAGCGIEVRSGYHEQNLPPNPDLVVIGNAISRGNPEAEAVLERRIPYCSLPELLKAEFIRGKRSIVVTGTHGKTTTTSLLAWVFERNGRDPSYLIGGLPTNFGNGARFTGSEWFIAEGDEYDTAFFDKRSKFVHYLPEVAIINNIEFDHADIFEHLGAVQASFRQFVNLIPRNGLLLANGDDPNITAVVERSFAPVARFGFGPNADIRAVDLDVAGDCSKFTVGRTRFQVALPGELNVRNALAVVACARHCGLDDAQIQSAFDTFQGIRRRMEIRGTVREITVIDDFGHHPTAVRETLRALQSRFPGRRLWAIFEPRSNTTRRKVFQEALVEAFSGADQVVIAQVARLELLPESQRLDPERLIREIRSTGAGAEYLPDVDSIVEHVGRLAQPGDVVCVFSNGGFGNIHTKLLERLAGE
jgi:UDP-N-acetylmuramate: L-alanyl-gamma-D-glutamyl-meso-diaminopimelate ligase